MTEPVLCYVKGPWAWFTTCPLALQRCDDYHKAPYEHNASDPYEWPHGNLPKYDLHLLAWRGEFETPTDRSGCNSVYSVEMINRGDIAWLSPSRWGGRADALPIHAGTPMSEFIRLVHLGGGEVFALCPKPALPALV